MTPDHCPPCPFASCSWCRYGGGQIPAATTVFGTMDTSHNETAPAGNRGLVPPKPLSLTEGRAAMIGAQTPTRTPFDQTGSGVANA